MAQPNANFTITPSDRITLGEIWSSSFQRLSPIVSTVEFLQRPRGTPEPGFSATKRITQMLDTFGPLSPQQIARLSEAQNSQEFEFLAMDFARQQRNLQIAGQTGFWRQLPSNIIASLFSPTTVLPVVGIAGAAGRTAIQTAGIVAAQTGGAVALDEAVLTATQTEYQFDPFTVVVGAAIGGALGGVVGGIARAQVPVEKIDAEAARVRDFASANEIDRIRAQTEAAETSIKLREAAGISADITEKEIGPDLFVHGTMLPTDALSIGRAARSVMKAWGYSDNAAEFIARNEPDLFTRLAKLSPSIGPLVRGANFPIAHDLGQSVALNLGRPGVKLDGVDDALSPLGLMHPAGIRGTTVEFLTNAQIRELSAKAVKGVENALARLFGIAENKWYTGDLVNATVFRRKGVTDKFIDDFMRYAHTGETVDTKEAMELVDLLTDQIIRPLTDRAVDIGLLREEQLLNLGGKKKYMPAILDVAAVAKNPEPLIQMLANSFARQRLALFNEMKDKIDKKIENLNLIQAARNVDIEEANEMIEEVKEAIKNLDQTSLEPVRWLDRQLAMSRRLTTAARAADTASIAAKNRGITKPYISGGIYFGYYQHTPKKIPTFPAGLDKVYERAKDLASHKYTDPSESQIQAFLPQANEELTVYVNDPDDVFTVTSRQIGEFSKRGAAGRPLAGEAYLRMEGEGELAIAPLTRTLVVDDFTYGDVAKRVSELGHKMDAEGIRALADYEKVQGIVIDTDRLGLQRGTTLLWPGAGFRPEDPEWRELVNTHGLTVQDMPYGALIKKEEARQKELRDAITAFYEETPSALEVKALLKKYNAQLRGYRQTFDALQEDLSKTMEAVDKLDDKMEKQIGQVVSQIGKLFDQLRLTTNPETAVELRKQIAAEYDKFYAKTQEIENQIAKLADKHPELVAAPARWTRRVQRIKLKMLEQTPAERAAGLANDPELIRQTGRHGEWMLDITSPEKKRMAEIRIRYFMEQNKGIESPAQQQSWQNWLDEFKKLSWTSPAKLEKAEKQLERLIAQIPRRANETIFAKRTLRAKGYLENLESGAYAAAIKRSIDGDISDFRVEQLKRFERRKKLTNRIATLQGKKIPEWYEQGRRYAEEVNKLVQQLEDTAARLGGIDYRATGMPFDPRHRAREDAAAIISDIIHRQGVYLGAREFFEITRGSTKGRKIVLDYDETVEIEGVTYRHANFMLRDPVKIARGYIETIVPDIHLTERLGDPTGAKYLGGDIVDESGSVTRINGLINEEADRIRQQIANDVDADGQSLSVKRTPEEKARLHERLEQIVEGNRADLVNHIKHIRHQLARPENPNSIAYRGERVYKNITRMILLGGTALLSVVELVTPILRHGIKPYMSDVIFALGNDMKNFGRAAKLARDAGQGLDPILNTRVNAMLDLEEINLNTTRGERIIDMLAAQMGRIALFNYTTAFTKQMVGAPIAAAQLSRAIETVMSVPRGGVHEFKPGMFFPVRMSHDEARRILHEANFNDTLVAQTWDAIKDMPRGRSNGTIIPDLDEVKSRSVKEAWQSYMSEQLDVTTITPGGEIPAFMRNSGIGRLLSMLRGYTASSTIKYMIPLLQRGKDVRAISKLTGLTLMVLMGIVAYYARALSHGPDTQQWNEAMNADIDKLIDEGIFRSGILFAFEEGRGLLGTIPGLREYVYLSDVGADRDFRGDIWDVVMGPSGAVGDRVLTTMRGLSATITDETIKQHQINAAIGLLPYSNVFYLREFFDLLRSVGPDQ